MNMRTSGQWEGGKIKEELSILVYSAKKWKIKMWKPSIVLRFLFPEVGYCSRYNLHLAKFRRKKRQRIIRFVITGTGHVDLELVTQEIIASDQIRKDWCNHIKRESDLNSF